VDPEPISNGLAALLTGIAAGFVMGIVFCIVLRAILNGASL